MSEDTTDSQVVEDQQVEAPARETQEVETEVSEQPEESESTESSEANKETEAEEQEAETPDQESEEQKEQKRQAYEQRQQRKQLRQDQELAQQLRQQERDTDPDDVQAQIQLMQAQRYVDQVKQGQNALFNDHKLVQANIPMFNPANEGKGFDQELYNDLIDEFNDQFVQYDTSTKDAQGNPILMGAYDKNGNEVSLYDFMERSARRFERAAQTGQRTGQQAERKMQSAAMTPPARASTDPSEDLESRVQNYKF